MPHGEEEAGKIRLLLETRQVNDRRRPLQRRQWPEEEETESRMQIVYDSMPTRFEPGASLMVFYATRALTTMAYAVPKG